MNKCIVFHCPYTNLSANSKECKNTSKGNKMYPYWKEEIELPLLTDDMIVHIENSKESTKYLLDLIREYGKCTEYRIKIQMLIYFLHTCIKICNLK